jgi:hypothetical protein
MKKRRLSRWLRWLDRNQHLGVHFPGVYVIAYTRGRLAGKLFAWRPEIIYIGMTNSAGGLRSRLQQFDNTIAGKTRHGGADRVRFRYRKYKPLSRRLFVAVAVFDCDVTSTSPTDLRVMGDVAQFEYCCLADFAERFGRVPTFNDKKNAPKFSLTVGTRRDTSVSSSKRLNR